MDPTADRLIAFLRSEGADEHRHTGGQSLLDHLVGTYEIARRWDQPVWLQHAALIHSIYGTDAHRRALLPVSRRPEVAELAGDQAERLAYLFCATPRRPLFAGTYVWARDLPVRAFSGEEVATPERGELDEVVLLHMANLAEQARGRDGSPGPWLVRVRELAEPLLGSAVVRLPVFIAGLASVSAADESLCAHAYRTALEGPDDRASRLALAAAACPVVAEPCVWQAYGSHRRGEAALAREWARRAHRRLLALGTAWDKRLSFDGWLELSERLGRSGWELGVRDRAARDPRELFEMVCRSGSGSRAGPSVGAEAVGRMRFERYLDTLADADGEAAARGVYPDLESREWYDPADFPLARRLQSNFAAIRAEILALEPSRFQPERERIPRAGDWDVVFLYERGRRHDDVCEACPVTAGTVEGHEAMRTAAGLVYVSRMRPGTHIGAHRGPTNLRLRCHLGIKVAPGDCAIRVGGETRRWREGACLVFDDYFEHEAWNHTGEDRIVLIVDLWHPGLSEAEVRLLQGLHRFAYGYARRLSRYWAANAAATRYQSPPKSPPSPPKSPPSPPSPQSPPSPPSPQSPPSPSPNRPSTASAPSPRPAPSADPISSVDSSPPPPNPLK